MLAYGSPVDSVDDTLRMAEDTIVKCTKLFPETMVKVYGEQYLRAPNAKDTTMLLAMHEAKGCPRMLGSADCMH